MGKEESIKDFEKKIAEIQQMLDEIQKYAIIDEGLFTIPKIDEIKEILHDLRAVRNSIVHEKKLGTAEMARMRFYPKASFVISSGNSLKDADVGTQIFNEITMELSKQNVPFDIRVKSGSFDFTIVIPMLLAVGSNTVDIARSIGTVMSKLHEHKKIVTKNNFNQSWLEALAVRAHVVDRNLKYKGYDSVKKEGRILEIGIRDDKNKVHTYFVDDSGNVRYSD